MTAQTVSGTVARREKADQLVAWLRGQQDELAMAAASHIKPSTIVRVTQGALRKDPKLMAAAIANPLSLLHCLLDAARLGHEPGTDQYYLVPFGQEVTGIEGYKGIIERMYRAGAVSAVVAEVVYQRDVYHRQGATQPPVHEFDEFADPADRGPLRGAYAYAVMLDGRFSKIVPMGRAEVMKHKAMSKGAERSDSPWQRWEESMWKKCPLRGLEPYVPTSSEWLAARAQAAASASRVVTSPGWSPPAQPAPEPQQVYDAEIVDEPEPQQEDKPRRQRAPRNPSPAGEPQTPAAASPPPADPAGEAPLPPLPGEEPDPTTAGAAPAATAPAATAPGGGEPDDTDYDTPGTATRGKGGQLTAIWTVLKTVFGFTEEEKPQARAVCEHIIERKLIGGTTGNLSRNEATTVLDTLAHWQQLAEADGSHPRDVLVALMAAGGSDE